MVSISCVLAAFRMGIHLYASGAFIVFRAVPWLQGPHQDPHDVGLLGHGRCALTFGGRSGDQ